MICKRRMNRLERIDMCTVVPYECMSVSEVTNGLIYLMSSSPTRVDAVWRALRPLKDGWNFLLQPLSYVVTRRDLYVVTHLRTLGS